MNADVEIFAQDGKMNEIYRYERSFHSDVETFVVWSPLLSTVLSGHCCHWYRCVRRLNEEEVFSSESVHGKICQLNGETDTGPIVCSPQMTRTPASQINGLRPVPPLGKQVKIIR